MCSTARIMELKKTELKNELLERKLLEKDEELYE